MPRAHLEHIWNQLLGPPLCDIVFLGFVAAEVVLTLLSTALIAELIANSPPEIPRGSWLYQ